ncbi:MAG: hypothetical protein HY810_06690 [Candidatus Omnitrophica bacterium]|nr:hypothetical protein [Candidatus Omnitrophota bacterium]
MPLFFKIYTFSWITACLFAVYLYVRNRSLYEFSHRRYWLFLFKPWKVIVFIFAGSVLTLIGPYTGDYTWDYYDTSLMAILTFITAPWAVGIVYRFWDGKVLIKQAFVAFCVWMVSASWAYDLYMYFRQGQYPLTWLSNIVLSSVLYLCAGLVWNLDYSREKGVFLSFTDDNWPAVSKGLVFHKIFLAMIPYALVVIVLCALIIHGLHFPR